ncbi:MAG: hypothetical protein P8Z37_10800 [Acidobacteriota bacterium]
MRKTVCFAAMFLSAAALFSLSFLAENSRAADVGKFAVAYSGNVMGYFESCG